MTLAEIDQHDQRADELDIEAVLGFAERVSLNAPRLWLEANLDQRQRFQAFLFPEGLEVVEGEIRTPVTASFYEELQHFTTPEERLVAHGDTSSNTTTRLRPSAFARLEKFLRRVDSFRRQQVAA